jgi:4-oxalocrotonate tautomerase
MPYVNVRVLEGVTAEQKLRLIERITQVLVEEMGKNPASTFVVIDEVPNDNWGHHGTSITKLRAAAAAEAKRPSAKKPAARKAPSKRPERKS